MAFYLMVIFLILDIQTPQLSGYLNQIQAVSRYKFVMYMYFHDSICKVCKTVNICAWKHTAEWVKFVFLSANDRVDISSQCMHVPNQAIIYNYKTILAHPLISFPDAFLNSTTGLILLLIQNVHLCKVAIIVIEETTNELN